MADPIPGVTYYRVHPDHTWHAPARPDLTGAVAAGYGSGAYGDLPYGD